jgi:hypothetical protein
VSTPDKACQQGDKPAFFILLTDFFHLGMANLLSFFMLAPFDLLDRTCGMENAIRIRWS